MIENRFTLCDNTRLIELASALHNESSKLDLAIFLQAKISEHLNDDHDCIFDLGSVAEIRFHPKDGEIEMTTRNGRMPINSYEFYGIKDWTFGKIVHISDELAAAIDRDVHLDPNENEYDLYEADFGEC